MITATYSLVQQLTSLHVMPPVRIVHTDDTSKGRIYAPGVNVLLLVGTIGLSASPLSSSRSPRALTNCSLSLALAACGFGTEVGLTNAYGFAVSGVMLITTLTLALAMVQLKGLPVLVALAYFMAAAFIDALFFGAALKKVPHGAWFPLGLAFVLLIVFTGWAWAKGLEDKFDAGHRYRLSEIMRPRLEREPDAELDADDEKRSPEAEQDITVLDGGNSSSAVAVAELRQRRLELPAYEAAEGGASLARLPVFALYVPLLLLERLLPELTLHTSRPQLPQPLVVKL